MKTKKVVKRKKRGKKRKVNHLKFNKGAFILLIGFILFILNSLYEIIFLKGASIEISYYLKLISFVLIYVGLIAHLIIIGDKPFLKSWNYIKSSKNFIYAVIGIFFAFALFAFFVPATAELEEAIMKMLKELIEKTQGLNQWQMTKFIFFNNLQSSFIGLIFGIIFGIFPVLSAVVNGYVLGFVASKSVGVEGISILWRLLPHGIFELPAVFISLGMGLKFGTFLFKKKKIKSLKEFFWNSMRVFIFIVIPLLIIAAIIEGILISFFG